MVRTDPFLYQVSVIRARRPGCRPHLRGVLRCFGFRSSPFLGATLLRGRPFALQCLAFRWREAEIAIYAPFAGYPEPVIAECAGRRSEEHTSALQSLMRISYAVFCLTKKKQTKYRKHKNHN